MVALFNQLEQKVPDFLGITRRQQPRGRCELEAEIHSLHGVRRADVRDLNDLGAFVLDDPNRVSLKESGVLRADPGPGLQNDFNALMDRPFVVVRKDQEGYGIRFVQLDEAQLAQRLQLPLPRVCVKRSSGEIETDWQLFNAHVPLEYLAKRSEIPPRTVEDAKKLAHQEPVAICLRINPDGVRMFRVLPLSELSRLQKENLLRLKEDEITQLHAIIATLKDERDEWMAHKQRLEQKIQQLESRERRLLRGMGLPIDPSDASITHHEPTDHEGPWGIPT
ncbi:MAG: PilZ domain-containing protein [Magnetococcales bacterium]|nr:PilZ domain-containing protein [Magnetococcales bacterium]